LTPETVAAARRDPTRAVLEGFHAVKHAIRFGAELVGLVTHDSEGLTALADDLAPDVAGTLASARVVDRAHFESLAPHSIPTPVLAVARRPVPDIDAVLASPGPVVLLDRPRHLGNLGAVVRVAAAAGAAGVLTTGDRDPWDPAALRGSAGLHFALPVRRVASLPRSDRPLAAVVPEGEPLRSGRLARNTVLAFGSERTGLDPGLAALADVSVAIPMRAGVSSLNLATAVAVVLYAG
jgi:TrmH family RNA methyltransferase